ncbi:MAG: carboxylating nicotinate-nucleotide diphosphorylase, partial [Gammaproteobacteria bacterium]|nr:carboxylating nicotinate-nucleotide diphosphorylase [Gammaproteobacteria bacterium]
MTLSLLHVPQSAIEEIVNIAIHEDVGDGDLTAQLIPDNEIALATVISREDCILCGMDWFEEVFRQIDDEILIEWNFEDGDAVEKGQTICSLSGASRSILTGERTALNFLQSLSATATLSSEYASAVAGTGAVVLDTRKTIPGLRLAQKYAVSCGGCQNHRIGLYDAILIKENHIIACGGIAQAIEEARIHNPEMPIEIEVENIDELNQALAANADRALLDNFNIEQLKEAVKI